MVLSTTVPKNVLPLRRRMVSWDLKNSMTLATEGPTVGHTSEG